MGLDTQYCAHACRSTLVYMLGERSSDRMVLSAVMVKPATTVVEENSQLSPVKPVAQTQRPVEAEHEPPLMQMTGAQSEEDEATSMVR